ncbi:MAG: metal-dependent hydrolase [Candidatus Hodarchaeales archaeon]|jgi:membrane-bound metal-dependent hydrolase YbcI (DUF457 family)
MKGVFHGTITLVYGLAIILPLSSILGMADILPTGMFVWALFLISFGSLVPDVDASDSMIFHEYPQLSQFLKYFIYYPIAKLYGDRKHRGIMHTIPGIFLTAGLLFLYTVGLAMVGSLLILLIYPSLIESLIDAWMGVEKVPFDLLYLLLLILVSFVSLLFGMFAHLWEDSTTISGIKWFPNKEVRYKGNLRVGGRNEDLAFTIYTGVGAIILLLEFRYAEEELIFQILFPLLSLGVFLLMGYLFRYPGFKKLFGEDILIKDERSRAKAQNNSTDVLINNKTYSVEKDRLQRGKNLVNEYKSMKNFQKRTNLKIIDRGDTFLSCNCKDFKVVGDLTLCKHLVAYLLLKSPHTKKELQSIN